MPPAFAVHIIDALSGAAVITRTHDGVHLTDA
jgi:hypothetical protein